MRRLSDQKPAVCSCPRQFYEMPESSLAFWKSAASATCPCSELQDRPFRVSSHDSSYDYHEIHLDMFLGSHRFLRRGGNNQNMRMEQIRCGDRGITGGRGEWPGHATGQPRGTKSFGSAITGGLPHRRFPCALPALIWGYRRRAAAQHGGLSTRHDVGSNRRYARLA